MKTKKQKALDREFAAGVACAAYVLAKQGDTQAAADAVYGAGYNLEELEAAGVEAHWIDTFRNEFTSRHRRCEGPSR